MIIKAEPIDSVIPAHQVAGPSVVRRSPQPLRRRGRVEVLLPTRKQVYGDDIPVFENASSFIEKNILKIMVKKEEDKSDISLPFFPTFLTVKKEEDKIGISVPYGKVEVKIKKEEMLSEDVVNRRIALVPSFNVDLDPSIRDVTTTRTFTSKRWGGNPQATFPTIRPEMFARHGLDDFMFLNLFFNPHAPQWPGAPGLFFTPSAYSQLQTSDWHGIQRVLVRLTENSWLYVGQYKCTPTLSLTPDEWKTQSPKVKYTWSTKGSTHGWGYDIRAKIVLQKRLGRNPTTQELQDAIASGGKYHATPEEIHRAFDEGHAVIRSWSMECVGYDENFQREIAAGNSAN